MNKNELNIEMQEYSDHLNKKNDSSSEFLNNCTGNVSPWSELKKGEITSEIIIAEKYYMDPNNNEGTYEERRSKIKEIIKKVFTEFISKRTKEYDSVKCHYRGIDWNQPGNSSWKSMSCRSDLRFVRGTIRRTTNGDWKGGPNYSDNDRTVSWKTGGHRHSETFIELDAKFFNINSIVINELNSARTILHERGIPTELSQTVTT